MRKKNFFSTFLVSFSLLLLITLGSLPVLRATTVGGLMKVVDTAPPQERPDVAYDTLSNRYLVVYSEGVGGGTEIMGRLYDAGGVPLGPAFNISNHPGQSDTQPAVTFKAATSEYSVVWRYGVPAGTNDIYGRRVRHDGVLIGGVIPIATSPMDEAEPDVAADPYTTGRYLVVWWEIGSASNRGRRLFNSGALDGGPFLLFNPVRTGPRVAFGGGNADYFLTATTDVNGRALVRAVRPGLPPDPQFQVNITPTAVGPGFGPALACHPTPGRWLVLWVGQGGNQIRGRFLDVAPAALPGEVMIVPPGGAIRSADVAAGFDAANQPRFNVAFERLGEILAVPLDAFMVVGPPENMFVDGINNDVRPAISYGRIPNQFFTVWQHNTGVSLDIYGQRHRLP
ncbi:MAG: hypothetical protein HY314_07665 [Acidobacteria bacterium]|nr:hypothetical protein [Acidobacteriota bacterium]